MSNAPEVKSLLKWANDRVQDWLAPMEAREFIRAAEIAIAAIQEVVRHESPKQPLQYRQTQFGVRVLMNALRDLSNIKIILAHENWITMPNAVEAAWQIAHDARERLVRHSGIDAEFLTYCLDELGPVFKAVESGYGRGLYTSWELELDGLACSVCNLDTRACEHVPGQSYGEVECRLIPEGGFIRAVALVQYPADPRCRIWPWFKRSKSSEGHTVIEDIPIYMTFTPEGDDDGGSIIDANALFTTAQLPTITLRSNANLTIDEPEMLGNRLG